MDAELFRRATEAFREARRLPVVERAAFIDRVCGDDSELRAELESLLSHHDDATAFLEQSPPAPAEDLASHSDTHPEQIGGYRIVETLPAEQYVPPLP